MKKLSAVLINLQNPKEKVWGVLISVQASGITVQGIDLNSFDDWSRGVARGDRDMGLSTVFFPIHRVERVSLDETVGSVLSLAETFEARAGQDVWSYLGLSRRLPAPGESRSRGDEGPEWMTLSEAESDYIARVLGDCEWDRVAAAEILDISEAALEKKIQAFGLRPVS
jgi:Bacterial regulatory protein, Fis family